MRALPCLGVLVAFALAISGCAMSRPVISSLDEVAPGDVVLVGAVKLSPPLADEEQVKDSNVLIIGQSFKNQVALLTDDEMRRVELPLSMGDYRNSIWVQLQETFFVAVPSQSFHILLGEIVLHMGARRDSAYLPGGLKVDIRKGDRAVYMGTLHYRRNEFFQIKDAQVRDDYARAEAEFRKKFGSKIKLRKRLARPATA